MKTKEIITESAQETQALAGKFTADIMAAKGRKNGKARLVCLWGDLGSGKTTFTQGMAKTLGVKEVVNSPTFLIMKKYPLRAEKKRMNLYHFDLYRIHDKQEISDLGWREILEDRNNIVVVEWPEKIKDILPEERIDIDFLLSGGSRRIVFHFES